MFYRMQILSTHTHIAKTTRFISTRFCISLFTHLRKSFSPSPAPLSYLSCLRLVAGLRILHSKQKCCSRLGGSLREFSALGMRQALTFTFLQKSFFRSARRRKNIFKQKYVDQITTLPGKQTFAATTLNHWQDTQDHDVSQSLENFQKNAMMPDG